jgi:hypothetical protein
MVEPSEAAKKRDAIFAENAKKNAWKKGQSGNPAGRPKNVLSVTAAMKKFLESGTVGKDKNKRRAIDALVKALVIQACRGNGKIAKEIWDRIDGKLADEVNVSGSMADIVASALKAVEEYEPEQAPEKQPD